MLHYVIPTRADIHVRINDHMTPIPPSSEREYAGGPR